MLDIHAHLYWESFDADRAEVIRRAREAGVEKIICVAATAEESKLAVALAEEHDLKASVGIHPEFFNEEKDSDFSALQESLRETAQNKSVVAIGECGLEYFSHAPGVVINEEQKERQKKGFLMQIELAAELSLPLILHCRDAYEDMYEILKKVIGKSETGNQKNSMNTDFQMTDYHLPIILHCYMGNTDSTERFLTLPNVYFSFTGNITYPVKKDKVGTKDDLTETVKMIPLERLFVETDCPFLAPQAVRGKRNEPVFVRHTFDKVCELQKVEKMALEKALMDNYARVFEK